MKLPTSPLEHLRALLYGPPSTSRWLAICALFDIWPPTHQNFEMGLHYAHHHLQTWPNTLRQAPQEWFSFPKNMWSLPAVHPCWSLVRHLSVAPLAPHLWNAFHSTIPSIGEVFLRTHLRSEAHMAPLTELSLGLGTFGLCENLLDTLVHAPVTSLETLRLYEFNLTNQHLAHALVGSCWFSRLTTFTLSTGVLSTSLFAKAIQQQRSLALQTLHLGTAQLPPAFFLQTLHTCALPHLHTFSSRAPLTADLVVALAQKKTLRELHLPKASLHVTALRALSKLPLHSLELPAASLSGSTGKAVRTSGVCTHLRSLSLSPSAQHVARDVADTLAHIEFQTLESLELSGLGLGDRELLALSNNTSLASVQKLFLAKNTVGAQGLGVLSKSSRFSKVRVLDLGQMRLTHIIAALGEGDALCQLQELHLAHCWLTSPEHVARTSPLLTTGKAYARLQRF